MMGSVLRARPRDFNFPNYRDGLSSYAPVIIPHGLRRYVIVRVWLPSNSHFEVGHVSLETPNEYVSLWPSTAIGKDGSEKNTAKISVKNEIEAFVREFRTLRLKETGRAAGASFNEAFRKVHVSFNTFARDQQLEGRPPDTELLLRHLEVEKIDAYIRDILRPQLQYWTLSGDTFSIHRILNKVFFLFDSPDSEHSAQSCASVVFNLLKIGGIEKLFDKYPGRPFGTRTAQNVVTAVGTLSDVCLPSIGWAEFAKGVQSTVNVPKLMLGASLHCARIPYGKTMCENALDDIHTSTAKIGMAVGTVQTIKAIQNSLNHTPFKKDNVSAFQLKELIRSDPNIRREKKRYSDALNSFEYLADALALTFKSPPNMDTLIRVAYVLEQQEIKRLEEKRRLEEEKRQVAHLNAVVLKNQLETPKHTSVSFIDSFCPYIFVFCIGLFILPVSRNCFNAIYSIIVSMGDAPTLTTVNLSDSLLTLFSSSAIKDLQSNIYFNNDTGQCFAMTYPG